MRLFLSYSRRDRTRIDSFVEVLRRGGQDIWMDTAISVGQDWQQTLRDSIARADGIVLALSPDWLDSPWCQWEFVTAAELHKKIIPVLLRPMDLPERISKYQYADFTGGFDDEAKVQRFFDGLLLLAAEIDAGAASGLSKPVLEEKIRQELKLGNVRDSRIEVSQIGEVAASQQTQIGDVSNSVVTIRNESTSIGTQTIVQAEQSRQWSIPVILALLIGVVIMAAAVFALLPESQRAEMLRGAGFIAISPTGTPRPLPSAGFNVVVAGLGYLTPDDEIIRDKLADDMSDILVAELNQITQIDNTLGWRNDGVGHILGKTPAEREAQAAAIASALNADVVIYGLIQKDAFFNIFEPEFYVTAEFAALEPELIGADMLGFPLEFVGNSEDQILAANSFQRRLGVMRFFLRGLAFYLAGNFTAAQESFEDAVEVEPNGLEVLYVFAGNAALRVPDPEGALTFYDSALRQRSAYSRALVGRGSALYRLAVNSAGTTPPPPDPSLTLNSQHHCADIDAALPESPQLLGELARRCFLEAELSTDKPNTADIDVKVAFGIGQVSMWLSLNNYGRYWDDMHEQLSKVVSLYGAASEDRQTRIRAASAHANAWLGLRLLSLRGGSRDAVCEAMGHYQQAVALLREDVNRQYNQRWIDIYGQQVGALGDWLRDRNAPCETLPAGTVATP